MGTENGTGKICRGVARGLVLLSVRGRSGVNDSRCQKGGKGGGGLGVEALGTRGEVSVVR